MTRAVRKPKRRHAHDPARRGYHAVYRQQEKNFCPGCGRNHWWLGRFSAECFYCGTALLYAAANFTASATHVRGGHEVGPIEG